VKSHARAICSCCAFSRASFLMKSRPVFAVALILGLALEAAQPPVSLRNSALAVRVRAQDGSYEIFAHGLQNPVLISKVGTEINGQWIRSADYPQHRTTESTFQDALGQAHVLTPFSGLKGKPDLVYDLRLCDKKPYGDITVRIENTTGKAITVQDIRVVDAVGTARIDLGGTEANDRVMAEPFSENPSIQIGDLAQAPHEEYRGVRDDLIYNQESKQSLLLAALTANRFLSILICTSQRGLPERQGSLLSQWIRPAQRR
jgi:hypothetical protein